MADLSSSLMVNFGQQSASASDSLSMSVGDGSSPAIYYYVWASKTKRLLLNDSDVSKNSNQYVTTSVIEYTGSSPGHEVIKLYYDGPEVVTLTVIRGQEFVSSRFKNNGPWDWEMEYSESIVEMSKTNILPVDSYDPPTIQYTSAFYNADGHLVAPPTWNETLKAFHHQEKVSGGFILTVSKRYRKIDLLYGVPDYVVEQPEESPPCSIPDSNRPDPNPNNEKRWTPEQNRTEPVKKMTLSEIVISATTRTKFSIIKIARSVDPRDGTVHLTSGQKQESSRWGYIDRVFPTAPRAPARPPKDTITGRRDYQDVERTAVINYQTILTDQCGKMRGIEFSEESSNSEEPDNAYVRGTFDRIGGVLRIYPYTDQEVLYYQFRSQ